MSSPSCSFRASASPQLLEDHLELLDTAAQGGAARAGPVVFGRAETREDRERQARQDAVQAEAASVAKAAEAAAAAAARTVEDRQSELLTAAAPEWADLLQTAESLAELPTEQAARLQQWWQQYTRQLQEAPKQAVVAHLRRLLHGEVQTAEEEEENLDDPLFLWV